MESNVKLSLRLADVLSPLTFDCVRLQHMRLPIPHCTIPSCLSFWILITFYSKQNQNYRYNLIVFTVFGVKEIRFIFFMSQNIHRSFCFIMQQLNCILGSLYSENILLDLIQPFMERVFRVQIVRITKFQEKIARKPKFIYKSFDCVK